jgi:hypothetical protein
MAGGSASARYDPDLEEELFVFRRADVFKRANVLADDEASTALIIGFWPMLQKYRPERWTDLSHEHDGHLIEDIKDATGFQVETVTFHSSSEKLFNAFWAKNFGKSPEENGPVVVFHGSSKAGIKGICQGGFDEKRLQTGAFGNGVYVSNDACVALMYAQPCKNGRLWVLFGNALLGDLAGIPVGWRAQTDFGKHPDGSDVLTLRDEEALYFCMKCENANNGQLQRQGYFAFSIDTSQPPSDFALISSELSQALALVQN